MAVFSRSFSACLFCTLLIVPAVAQPKALPAAAEPPLAVPAVLFAVTFQIKAEDENCKLVVTSTPALLRVDDATDGYSIVYNSATEHYSGLEHRNYTYWEFSWPEVKAAVQGTKRYETRLKDLGIEGLNADLPPSDAPNPAITGTNSTSASPPDASSVTADSSSASSSDTSGYVWRPTTDKKRIADLDCVRWTGESVSGSPVEAWCYPGVLPKVQGALAQLRVINEPIALVPVRTLVPPFVFEVSDSLNRGGVTPVLITWGGDVEKNRFALLSVKTRAGNANLFTVPKLYVKTTLVTMDGIGTQKPERGNPGPSAFPIHQEAAPHDR